MSEITVELPRWYDLHAHFRQGELVKPMVEAHIAMGCAGVVAMPNTRPPLTEVFAKEGRAGRSIEGYRSELMSAAGGRLSEVIVPLYLTRETTPELIASGAASGVLKAAKYYPPHGTTGSEQGWHFSAFMENGVFAALEAHDVVLCIHGEVHGLQGEAYFGRESNAEERFYREEMPRLRDRFPGLRVVAEHLTTRVGVDFVLEAGSGVAATVTPQHLIYTVGDLVQNLKYHLYCLPLVKFEADRQALRAAVTAEGNDQFFAGTDSAPHTTKVTPCGCAAGCFTGGIAPQLYAEAFEQAGVDLASPGGQSALRRFLVENGAAFYQLPVPAERFQLIRAPSRVEPLATPEGVVVPLPLGMGAGREEGVATLKWRLNHRPDPLPAGKNVP